MTDVQPVLAALDVFSRAPDKVALENANTWLQDFQHSSEAWSVCNILLLTPDAPPAAKLFAAQTFRTKVTYDLSQITPPNLLPLRDTLVTALERYSAGPRSIIVQLCLAISGLALQLPTWQNPVQDMIDSFGRTPATVPALLQFLSLLPEEVTGNTKIPVSDDEYKEREGTLLTTNAQKVVELLSMYIQAPGASFAVQSQVFLCLSSWLNAGEVTADSLAQTPLLHYAFEALASDPLFDAAVTVICDLIHETQEVEDSMHVIELIVPRVIALRPKLVEYKDSPEKIRGLAKILTEAGETYRSLLLHHTETFFPIVEAIGECSAYHDLDIVPITFHFWMRLAQSIGKKPSVSPLFIDAYKALMGVIIQHLHFPQDSETLTGQEADDFRQFRHVMGDTLKDCCYVLGADVCLLATYDMITSALARSNVSWQEIEAPLFSMRSMGAEVDINDDKAVPKIMDLIPALPAHPRVRYAALLIISRYTEWINKHADYIQFQLQYVSAGFEDDDQEVNAAAGQALKYLCQDCRRHLVDFLPQLHTFVSTIGAKLGQDEKVQVYEAVAYVISAMPMDQAAQSLRTFSLDLLSKVHGLLVLSKPPSKEEIHEVACALENLEVMLGVIETFGDELPSACQNTPQEAWAIFEPFLHKFGDDYQLCERATRVLRLGINFFSKASLPVLPAVLRTMGATFKATGHSSYIWIAGKAISRFGNEEDPLFRSSLLESYEQISSKVFTLLQGKTPGQIPDVIEDYMQMLLQMIDLTPDIIFPSSAFPVAFRAALAGLTLVQADIVFAALDFVKNTLDHDCLAPWTSPSPPPPKFSIYAAAIQSVLEQEGVALTGYLLSGLTGDFPGESTSIVISIFRGLAALQAEKLLSWLPNLLQGLPSASVSDQAKAAFMTEMSRAITSKEYEKVKPAVIGLHRASLKARERRRGGLLNERD